MILNLIVVVVKLVENFCSCYMIMLICAL